MIRFLFAEGHWEFYCNPTYHFSEYHSCLVHFQITTSNNSLYLHKWAFLSNCMVPGVLWLIKIVILKTTLYIFLNYYPLYLNEMFEINYLLTYLLYHLIVIRMHLRITLLHLSDQFLLHHMQSSIFYSRELHNDMWT